MTVQIQRFCHCSSTNDHISSTSRISSACAGRSVSSIFGFCSSFFEPARQCITADTKGTLDTSHTRTFTISRKNLFLLFRAVSVLRFKYATFVAVFTPELLIAKSVMTILDNISASTISTGVYYSFGYHISRLSHFTYFEPLPKISSINPKSSSILKNSANP